MTCEVIFHVVLTSVLIYHLKLICLYHVLSMSHSPAAGVQVVVTTCRYFAYVNIVSVSV